MKKIYSLIALSLAFLLIFASCGAKEFATDDGADFEIYQNSSSSNGLRDYGTYDAPSEEYIYVQDELKEAEVITNAQESPLAQRKIIYTSSYKIQTTEFDNAIQELDALIEKYGAYYEESDCHGTKEKANRRASFSIRVPVENYFDFRNETGSIGVIIRSSESNRDVSESYFDTEARLESAKLREERLLEILKTADTLDNILLLEQELADVRYEIESMSGTLRKYDSLISYSTINIDIDEVIDPVKVKTAPKTFGERIVQAISSGFEDFGDLLEDFAVSISYNIPTIIVLAIVIIVIIILIKKKKASKKKPQKVIEDVNNKEY